MKKTPRSLPLWLGLLLLSALSIYGFWSNALFEQETWTSLGLQRLRLAATFYTISVLAVYCWKPTFTLHAFFLFFLAYAGAAVGPAAPLAVLYFLCSSLFLGRLFFRANEPLDYLQALLLGIGIWILLIAVAARFPINTGLSYLIAFSIPIAAGRRFMAEFYRTAAARLQTAPPRGAFSYATLALLMFLLLMHYLAALKPAVSPDGLAMHMVVASRLAAHSLWSFDVREFIWAVMPMGGDWAFSGVYLLGGEYAARLLNFSIFVLVAMLLFAAIRSWLSQGTALLLTALYASTPLVQLITGSLFVENIWTAFVTGAAVSLWRYHTTHRAAYLFLLGIFLGCAIQVKYGSLSLLPLILALALLEWRKARRLGRASSATLLTFLLALVIFASPPYLTAYGKTGNPVFPFMNDLFHSPLLDTSTSLRDTRWPQGVQWSTFYAMTFQSTRHLEGQAGSFGFHYLLLLPLVFLWLLPRLSATRLKSRDPLLSLSLRLLLRKPPYLAAAALLTGLGYWLLTGRYIVYLRYFYPVLPLFMIAIGWVFLEARHVDSKLYRMLQAAAVSMIFLNAYYMPASGWWHRDFSINHFDSDAESDYRDYHAPIRRLVDYLNAVAPGAAVAFLTDDARIAPLRGPIVAAHWHFPEFLKKLESAGSPQRIFTFMKEMSIEYFIVPTAVNSLRARSRFLPAFVKTYTAPVPQISSGEYYLARLAPEDAAADLRRMRPGSYDDSDDAVLYSGSWVSGSHFDEAFHNTVTYSNEVGSSFRFAFRGNHVTWVYTKAFNRGRAAVIIDGWQRGTIDLYSDEIEWRTKTIFSDLSEGPHELEISVLGEKDSAASDYFVDVDLLIVE